MISLKNQSADSNLIIRDALMQLMDVCFPTLETKKDVKISALETKVETKTESKDLGKSDKELEKPQDLISVMPKHLISHIKEKFIIVLKPQKEEPIMGTASLSKTIMGPITSFKCAAYKLAHTFRTKFSMNIGHIFSFSHKAFAAEIGHDQLAEILNHPEVLRVEHDYILTAQGFKAAGDQSDVKLVHSKNAPKIIGSTEFKDQTNILARLSVGSGVKSEGVFSAQQSGYSQQTVGWHIQDLNGPNSSQSKYAGKRVNIDNVQVFVIDTGVDVTHPDLRVVESKNFVSTESSAAPRHLHGSHAAGILAAIDNDSGVVGVAPGAPIHSLKVLDSSGSGQMSWVMAGVDYVAQFKRQNPSVSVVVNMSLGFYTGTTALNAIDEAVIRASELGIVFCIAAGNDHLASNVASPGHVATVCSAITVGAYNKSKNFCSFSNHGSAVTVSGPGENVLSTALNGSYATLSGTSMSCPGIAGLCALYLSKNPGATPEQVKHAIVGYSRKDYVKNVPKGTTTLAAYNAFYD